MALKWYFIAVFLVMELSSLTNGFTLANFTSRHKRQTRCGEYDFVCDDGNCIEDLLRCDGKKDCPDGSDETGACRQLKCPKYAFRCAYGACIDGSAECNGVKECIDESDELTIRCPGILEYLKDRGNCSEGYSQCRSGECVFEDELCNGKADCPDASDEYLARCFNYYCPSYAFKCDYGACVSGDSKCNGKYDCFDGSDEAEDLCGKPPPPIESTPRPPGHEETVTRPPPPGACKAPIFESGRMFATNNAEIFPGQIIENGQIVKFRCVASQISEETQVYCISGTLLPRIPQCTRHCSNVRINTLSVKADCKTPSGGTDCSTDLPPGTVVNLRCKQGYTMPKEFVETRIKCLDDGSWSHHIFKCNQVCGVIEEGYGLVSGGEETNITQVPWQAAIFERISGRFIQICGGSIITPTAVVSAAHCFWDRSKGKKRDANDYQVAVGKTYRDYYLKEVTEAQFFNVSLINTVREYNDQGGLYTGDIAIVELSGSIEFGSYIKPICLIPTALGNDKYVLSGDLGRVAGWGMTQTGDYSSVLKTLDLYTVDYATCRANSTDAFKDFITFDKFCAGNPRNSNVCSGDSGGGFMMPMNQTVNGRLRQVFYLRGIVSVGAFKGLQCFESHYTAFTNIQYFFDIFNKYIL
ncbi:modular serine protease-like [Phlebotomus argentipes]|uniref:modular serine protease-like n=1 Tax=Phlebotomus argentipes TaxID=94469 RepID=UPI00289381CE|nr:modular serine protease-like [Phlebotomus argentipes]